MFAASFLKFTKHAARWLLLPAIVIVLWGELAPAPDVAVNVWDKLLHFTAYFGLAGLSLVALGPSRTAIIATIGLIAVGGILEIVQGMVGRDASWGDELANTLGAITGCALGWAIVRLLERAAAKARPSK